MFSPILKRTPKLLTWGQDKVIYVLMSAKTWKRNMDDTGERYLPSRFRVCNGRRVAGPCLTTAIWRCCKNSSQWHRSFHWKLRSHWLKFLRQRRVAVVIQGPGYHGELHQLQRVNPVLILPRENVMKHCWQVVFVVNKRFIYSIGCQDDIFHLYRCCIVLSCRYLCT